MNELIDRLATEANVEFDHGVPLGFAHKFAELIVKECAGLLDGEWEKEILCGSDAAGILKQHFGVEE